MIQTYGLFWKSEWVDWGALGPGNRGALLGVTGRRNAEPVDFRYQRGIYALYSQFDLVYVGQTGGSGQRLLKRLNHHRSDHLAERWDRFSWFGMRWVKQDNTLAADARGANTDVQTALNIMEAVAIAIAEPRLNLQRGKWGNAQQYLQVEPQPDDYPEE